MFRGARFSASAYIAMDVDIRMHSGKHLRRTKEARLLYAKLIADPSRRTCPTFSTLSCGVTQLSGFKLTKAQYGCYLIIVYSQSQASLYISVLLLYHAVLGTVWRP